jgi:2-polyprenyl-3-methyl-5-hydroxy-6-metoxy-1,4-benzoquinol methylase
LSGSFSEGKNAVHYYDRDYYAARYSKRDSAIEPYLRSILSILIHDISFPAMGDIMILDVGCGVGNFVAALGSMGATALGIDASPFAARCSKQIQAVATHLPFREASIQLLTTIHVIEHLQPSKLDTFLEEAKRVLTPGGIVLIVTPNALSPLRVLQGKRWFYDPSHVNVLSSIALKSILRLHGFSNIESTFDVSPRTRPGHRQRDIVLFLLTRTGLSQIRNVSHIVARKKLPD